MSISDPSLSARPPSESRRPQGRQGESGVRAASSAAVSAARVLTTLVQLFVLVSSAILALGFVLLLFGANADAPFAEWVYRALERVMAPFRGLFEEVQITGESVLDPSVLFAMVVYGIAGLALGALIERLTHTPQRT